MVGSKLYLDGCSFTYGLNLPPEHTLAYLFSVDGGYKVTNGSRNGKSNLAIAMDAYKNSQEPVDIEYAWRRGDILTWNRDQLHASADFTRFGVTKKFLILFIA